MGEIIMIVIIIILVLLINMGVNISKYGIGNDKLNIVMFLGSLQIITLIPIGIMIYLTLQSDNIIVIILSLIFMSICNYVYANIEERISNRKSNTVFIQISIINIVFWIIFKVIYMFLF